MRTIIIGAGAAGLAAGRALQDAGQDVLILEARDRIGGRVWTDRTFANIPIENGAEWVHGHTAASWKYVTEAGLSAIRVNKFRGYLFEHLGRLKPYEELRAVPGFERIINLEEHEIGEIDPAAPDKSVKAWIDSLGLPQEWIPLAYMLVAHPYFAEPDEIGVADLSREVRAHHAGYDNFRLRDGYDQMFTHMARGLDVRLGAPVTRVRWGKRGAAVLAGGDEITADKVIITVPLSLLQQNVIAFNPILPAWKTNAIHALRMGWGMKAQLKFSSPFWDVACGRVISTAAAPVWWSPTFGRPEAEAVMIGFIGGDRAKRLYAMPEAQAIEVMLDDLCRLFQTDAPRKTIQTGRIIRWADDEWARGGYSFVPTGAYDSRAELARAVDGVLHFAGEATVTASNPATVHGAIESGWRAAAEIAAGMVGIS